jgi:intracellular multiplication protein IcmK
MGNVTTLSILDATGQPWPIQDISWAGNFEVLQPEQGSHMLRITPMSEFATGNVSMRLIGLTPPIIFTMKTDRRSVQVRADVQIPQNGPNAVIAPVQAAPTITTAAGDIGMTQILEGVPPTEAQKMKIAGVDGRTSAYDVNGVTYVRTPYTLLSPAWNASLRSADGTNVYALRFAPVLLLSDKGQLRKARLERVDTDNE